MDGVREFASALLYRGRGSGIGGGIAAGAGALAGLGSGRGYAVGEGSGESTGDCRDTGSGGGWNNKPAGYGRGEARGAGYDDGTGRAFDTVKGVYSRYDIEGISSVNGYRVYPIDGVPTILTRARDGIAEGYIFGEDFQLTPCSVAMRRGIYAHGATKRAAVEALREKLRESEN